MGIRSKLMETRTSEMHAEWNSVHDKIVNKKEVIKTLREAVELEDKKMQDIQEKKRDAALRREKT